MTTEDTSATHTCHITCRLTITVMLMALGECRREARRCLVCCARLSYEYDAIVFFYTYRISMNLDILCW